MRTRGLEVHSGYLVPSRLPDGRPAMAGSFVPDQFWGRLKQHMTRAGVLDAFAAEYRQERDRFVAQGDARDRHFEAGAEMALFKRWTLRVVGAQRLWPWDRGWATGDVDAYLSGAPAMISVVD